MKTESVGGRKHTVTVVVGPKSRAMLAELVKSASAGLGGLVVTETSYVTWVLYNALRVRAEQRGIAMEPGHLMLWD